MKRILLHFLKMTGALWLLRSINKDKSIILMYHGVTAETEFPGLINHSGMQLAVGRFADQMKFIHEHYNVIPLKQLVESLIDRRPIPPYAVSITFDDGYRNNFTQAFPILMKYRLPATIFLSTRFVDGEELLWADRLEALFDSQECYSRISSGLDSLISTNGTKRERLESLIRYCKQITEEEKEDLISSLEARCSISRSELPSDYLCLSWEQVREMQKSGLIDFGSHTHSHVIMTRVSPERAGEEVALSNRLLEENTGLRTDLFSYPNGAKGDYSEDTHGILQRQAFKCALLTVEGFNGTNSNLFELKRIGIHNDSTQVEFEAALTGVRSLVFRILKGTPGRSYAQD